MLPRSSHCNLTKYPARRLVAPSSCVTSWAWPFKFNGTAYYSAYHANLAVPSAQFDVFVPVDRNLSFQQDIVSFSIAVVVLQARTNRPNSARATPGGRRRQPRGGPQRWWRISGSHGGSAPSGADDDFLFLRVQGGYRSRQTRTARR